MRVLCLHGGQQTAEIFENQLSKLANALAVVARFDFVDAPFLLPRICAEDDVETRSWCSPTGDYTEGDRVVDSLVTMHNYDVLLGFSQGGLMASRYLMHHMTDSVTCVKGVVFIGTPDPRRAFEGSALLSQYAAPSLQFLGNTPSLHIVGKRDTIVPPEESVAFAEACGETAALVLHEHAHCVPQVRAVLSRLRSFFDGLTVESAELEALRTARDNELDFVASMYGEEYITNRNHADGATVTLPFVTDGTDGDAAILERLRITFVLPRRYPAVAASVDIRGGPVWHHVGFERWRGDVVVRCTRYMLEDIGLGGAMLLPVFMYANEQALEALGMLREAFAAGPEGHPATEADNTRAFRDVWSLEEDDDSRAEYIDAAEADAIRLLGKEAKRAFTELAAEDVGGLEKSTLIPSKRGGGTWTLTIGLIGKPSAGKSTFFNALTDPQSESEAARVAAFPFTTIDPNVGTGYGPVECPCQLGKEWGPNASIKLATGAPCDAAYGHVTAGGVCYRRHPILVKDVAGLVKGAYRGKGKGNRFLNDLCDADVLIHVVDGAGATDADGTPCPPGQGTATEDIAWVRAEVQCWIYDNLCAKWDTIRRFPSKLLVMFSGYRSSPTFVEGVLRYMGITDELSLTVQVRAWGPRDLHLFVALYIRMRFPMVVALNKADLPSAAAMRASLLTKYPGERFVAMSAQTECHLLHLRRRGLVEYELGEGSYRTLDGTPSKDDAKRLEEVAHFFESIRETSMEQTPAGNGLPALTSTGVHHVVQVALASCAAFFVFPVASFQCAIPSLQHCFSFRQGTTADDVFWAMSYAKLLDGKFVRCEVVDAHHVEHGSSVLKKMEPLPFHVMLVRILSNKRQMH